MLKTMADGPQTLKDEPSKKNPAIQLYPEARGVGLSKAAEDPASLRARAKKAG